MSDEQATILAVLAGAVALFLWGRWRHDMVAVAALLVCVACGLVAPEAAFAGFGHPAVVTVACVLVLSQALQASGAVDMLTRGLLPAQAGPTVSLLALCALAAALSGFMNNVGALALLMPVAVQMAQRLELPPGRVLMPLAFASILGGTTTLIGTPPNLIVSGIRAEAGLGAFELFAFAPVGVGITVAGVAFVALVGWRLVPARSQGGIAGFESGAYITEARVPAGSRADGASLGDIDQVLEDAGAQLLGLVRRDLRVYAPRPGRRVHAEDILVVEAEADVLPKALSALGLELEEAKQPEKSAAAADGMEDTANEVQDESADASGVPAVDTDRSDTREAPGPEAETDAPEPAHDPADIVLMEYAVLPGAALAGRSPSDLLLRTRYGINLLALSRSGQRSIARLRSVVLEAGDLILLQGPPDALAEFAANMGCVPLAARDLRIPNRRKALTAAGVLIASVLVAASGMVSAAVAFATGVLATMALRTLPPRAVYQAVDWPVVVLLAALLPVAGAMQATGAAEYLAGLLITHLAGGGTVTALAVVLVTTLLLTDVLNNAATAAVMSPIALGTAANLGADPDSFLMAVAIGASLAFLTPIGHQNNTLILGPGGFRFGDYWRLGLPLELVVVVVALPLLLWVWPP